MGQDEDPRVAKEDKIGKFGKTTFARLSAPFRPLFDHVPIVYCVRSLSISLQLRSCSSHARKTELNRLHPVGPALTPGLDCGRKGVERTKQTLWPFRLGFFRPAVCGSRAMVVLPRLSTLRTLATPSFKSPHQRPVTKIVFSYCPYWISSSSLRSFLDSNAAQLARTHPSVEFVVKQRLHKHGFVQGIYSERRFRHLGMWEDRIDGGCCSSHGQGKDRLDALPGRTRGRTKGQTAA
jgi:hypothetical protein